MWVLFGEEHKTKAAVVFSLAWIFRNNSWKKFRVKDIERSLKWRKEMHLDNRVSIFWDNEAEKKSSQPLNQPSGWQPSNYIFDALVVYPHSILKVFCFFWSCWTFRLNIARRHKSARWEINASLRHNGRQVAVEGSNHIHRLKGTNRIHLLDVYHDFEWERRLACRKDAYCSTKAIPFPIPRV